MLRPLYRHVPPQRLGSGSGAGAGAELLGGLQLRVRLCPCCVICLPLVSCCLLACVAVSMLLGHVARALPAVPLLLLPCPLVLSSLSLSSLLLLCCCASAMLPLAACSYLPSCLSMLLLYVVPCVPPRTPAVRTLTCSARRATTTGGAQYCHRNADPELPGVCAASDDGQVGFGCIILSDTGVPHLPVGRV